MNSLQFRKIAKEIVGIFLALLFIAPIAYWRIWGFPPVDNIFDKFLYKYPLLSYSIMLVLLPFFLFLSVKEYQKGENFEIIRIVSYGFGFLVILMALMLGIVN